VQRHELLGAGTCCVTDGNAQQAGSAQSLALLPAGLLEHGCSRRCLTRVTSSTSATAYRPPLALTPAPCPPPPPPCRDGDEEDGFDETLLPNDYKRAGEIVDDELNRAMVRPLPQGAVLHALVDACHSGTALDLPFRWGGVLLRRLPGSGCVEPCVAAIGGRRVPDSLMQMPWPWLLGVACCMVAWLGHGPMAHARLHVCHRPACSRQQPVPFLFCHSCGVSVLASLLQCWPLTACCCSPGTRVKMKSGTARWKGRWNPNKATGGGMAVQIGACRDNQVRGRGERLLLRSRHAGC
jgi:hypothetical protein